MGEWQPIETAPKNLRMLVVDINGVVWLVQKVPDWKGFRWSSESGLGDFVPMDEEDAVAWMPLPDPPETD